MSAFLLLIAITASVMIQSVLPALIILIPIAFIAFLVIVSIIDMNKAYVQIDGDHITVVDYYFFFRKERYFKIHEIKKAEFALGSSFRVRGYRYGMMGFSYIIFRDENNKYLFKVVGCPETNEFFSKYFEIQYIYE